jgi:hypothetical protein
METGKALMYPFIESACNDNVKADDEIAVDCGVAACNKKCDWGGKPGTIEKDENCDQNEDCATGVCTDDGVCGTGIYSCYDVKRFHPKQDPEDGYYDISIDSDRTDLDNVVDSGQLVEVWCDFYDGRAFTLFEMMCKAMHYNGLEPYNARDKVVRHPKETAKIGRMFNADQNQCARYEVKVTNSIFKHSEGYVMTRWNDNKDEYHVTDVFGTPEDGKHFLDPEHKCSQKEEFNLAMGYRQRPSGVNNGYCWTNGKINTDNNCVCNDQHTSNIRYNGCNGDYGNWRRYNGRKGRSAWCSTMYDKCHTGGHHGGPLGDTHGCDVSYHKRTIGGHFWTSHSPGNAATRGMPCDSYYGAYGCFGSRWIG